MNVLLIGDPRLQKRSARVDDVRDIPGNALKKTLARFRAEYGFGRAISAPQIGVNQRFIAMDLGNRPLLVINPRITWKSRAMFTLWDDCMSFPWMLVKVRRHASITVKFQDADGKSVEWGRLGRAESELFQHEIDHLDGILAIERAIDRRSFRARPDTSR